MEPISPEEIAWAAGLFEGEGCFSSKRSQNTARRYPNACLSMTDEDVVRKFFHIVRTGAVYGPVVRKNKKWKPQWKWSVSRYEDVAEIGKLFLPWLGWRRQQQLKDTLQKSIDNPPVDRYAINDRYKNTKAFKMFGKRYTELTPKEIHRYCNTYERRKRSTVPYRKGKDRPSREQLLRDIERFQSWLLIADKYGVTDRAVRKWAEFYKIEWKQVRHPRKNNAPTRCEFEKQYLRKTELLKNLNIPNVQKMSPEKKESE